MILVSKYTFSGPSIKKKTITNTHIWPLTSMLVIFQNGRQNIHVLISPLLTNIENKFWCLNIHFQDQDKGLGKIIRNTYLNDLINAYSIVLLIYLQIIATLIWMQIHVWQCFWLIQAEIESIKKWYLPSNIISRLQFLYGTINRHRTHMPGTYKMQVC